MVAAGAEAHSLVLILNHGKILVFFCTSYLEPDNMPEHSISRYSSNYSTVVEEVGMTSFVKCQPAAHHRIDTQ